MIKKQIIYIIVLVFTNSYGQNYYDSFIKSNESIDIKYFPELNVSFDTLSKKESNNIKIASFLETGDMNSLIELIKESDFDAINEYSLELSLGAIYLSINNPEIAYQHFEKVIGLCKDKRQKSEFYYILSVLDAKKGKQTKADYNLTKSFESDSSNIYIALILANKANESSNNQDAITYYKKVLSLNNKLNNIKNVLGSIYQEINEHLKAIKLFSEIIDTEPGSAYAFSNRSFSYLKEDKIKKALSDINNSISLLPSNSFAYKNRALIYFEIDKKEEGCTDLDKAIELGYLVDYGTDIMSQKKENCN